MQKLKELIEKIENELIWIKTRLTYLKEIDAEFQKATGSNRFMVRNDIVYRMVSDSYDMVVIDLASLCRGMLGRGGFFNLLKNHLKQFKRADLKKIQAPKGQIFDGPGMPAMTDAERAKYQESIDWGMKAEIKKNLDSSFDRLFPPLPEKKRWKLRLPCCRRVETVKPEKVTQEHIDALKDRFEKLTETVVRDRDARRAHRFEPRKSDSAVSGLSLQSIEESFEKIERIVNDIRAITAGGHFIYTPPTMANKEKTAEDLVDIVLFGSFGSVLRKFGVEAALKAANTPLKYYWQYREDYYEQQKSVVQPGTPQSQGSGTTPGNVSAEDSGDDEA